MGTGTVEFQLTNGPAQRVLSAIFTQVSEAHSYSPVILGADRHGSLIWEAAKSGKLMRYVTLSVTVLPEEKAFLETWVVVSKGERFTRREAGTADVSGNDVNSLASDEDRFGVERMLEVSFEIAESIKYTDLNETLPFHWGNSNHHFA